MPWTGRVEPWALVEGFFLPSSWSSFLRIASSFLTWRLRAISEAETPSAVLGALGMFEGEATVVRFMEGVPTVEPPEDFW